jgi:hypothetical protein
LRLSVRIIFAHPDEPALNEKEYSLHYLSLNDDSLILRISGTITANAISSCAIIESCAIG